MNIFECSKQLRELTKAHANYTMSLDDYRRDRKVLLDALDHTVNGIANLQSEALPSVIPAPIASLDITQHLESHEQHDKTQPYLVKKIDECMNFIKGTNIS
ncbi:hypothetical protein CXF85_11990 [Colwellia sp. 75C3]|uniref:hypothetical protein n=1 Tax=Colwellia sp. 75C3 TaxID=888425 RepID=UPI000C32BBB4|nr:hypothetical protein [Colwellia sp. 75C3]PKG83061.1 hypothetical protein CXF85_11990 [Colwellia sp. 75C3]